jgi:DHA1 family bicyclomycin/chloramphenicol resistance-like MFS transporter
LKLSELTEAKHRWMLWGTLASLSAFPAMATDLYLPAFPAVAEQFGATTYEVQLTLSSFFYGMGIGQLIWGATSDRLGRKLPTILGIALFVLGSIACSFATNIWFLVIARFVQALGGAAAMTIVRAIVRDLFSGEEMARTMAAVMSIFMAAPILAPSIGALILHFGEWHWIFIGLAVFGVLAAFNFMRMPETLPMGLRQTNGVRAVISAYGAIVKNHEFRFAVMQSAAASLLLFAYVSLIPSVLMIQFGATPEQFGLFFGVNALSLVAGAQINRRVLRRIKTHVALRRFVLFQAAMAIVLFVVSHAAPVLWLILPLLMLTIGANTSIGGNSATLAMAPFQGSAAQASALVGVVQSLAAATSAAIVAFLPGQPLDKMTTTILAVTGLTTGVLLLRERRFSRKQN